MRQKEEVKEFQASEVFVPLLSLKMEEGIHLVKECRYPLEAEKDPLRQQPARE